jgi:hypothetical protein
MAGAGMIPCKVRNDKIVQAKLTLLTPVVVQKGMRDQEQYLFDQRENIGCWWNSVMEGERKVI